MASSSKILDQMRREPSNVRFADLKKVCEAHFGKPRQTGTSHAIFKTPWVGDPRINIQDNKGKAKAVGITASGTKARYGTIAADTSIFPFGTIMYIPGYGYGVVEDRGGDIKGYHIDLYYSSHQTALEWGKEIKKVKVWFPAARR